jgi:hypothetical protein
MFYQQKVNFCGFFTRRYASVTLSSAGYGKSRSEEEAPARLGRRGDIFSHLLTLAAQKEYFD